jgi:hypothetical protein
MAHFCEKSRISQAIQFFFPVHSGQREFSRGASLSTCHAHILDRKLLAQNMVKPPEKTKKGVLGCGVARNIHRVNANGNKSNFVSGTDFFVSLATDSPF